MMYALIDGDKYKLAYIWQMGIHPDVVMFDLLSFQKKIPYITAEDSLLFLVSGCTTFSLSEVTKTVELLQSTKHLKKYLIYSNIPLNLGTNYVLYEGSPAQKNYQILGTVMGDIKKSKNAIFPLEVFMHNDIQIEDCVLVPCTLTNRYESEIPDESTVVRCRDTEQLMPNIIQVDVFS